MKVGTDGVLLGAWAGVRSGDRHILDIGTGTGLIALMMAQRSQGAQVDAIEIDADSAEQARENIAESEWVERVDIKNVNIIDFNDNIRYDLIVSNPPFFSDSLLPPDKGRSSVRHTITLTFSDLRDSVLRLLAADGRFALILPTNESDKFEKESKGLLFLTRRCNVLSRESGDIKRVMSEYSLVGSDNIACEELAIREANSNDYTQQYRELTADFYLKF